jgi:RNA polymerase sigma factor (sigma-70 family)
MNPDTGESLAALPENIAWARKQGRWMARHCPSLRDDLESAALLGLVQAANTFDPTRGLTFKTHALCRIRGAVWDEMRYALPRGYRHRSRKDLPIFHPIADVIEHVIEGHDDPVGWEVDYQEWVEWLSRQLPRQAARVIRCMYGHASTLLGTQTAEVLGMSRVNVSRIRRYAVDELREFLTCSVSH